MTKFREKIERKNSNNEESDGEKKSFMLAQQQHAAICCLLIRKINFPPEMCEKWNFSKILWPK